MTTTHSTFRSPVDDLALGSYAWTAAGDPRGVVQIAHGVAEHSGRYDRLARVLNERGYLAYALDHRGHGRSIAGVPGDFGAAGFDGLVADLAAFGEQLGREHPGSRVFLIAHSMGSFAAQQALLDHSSTYSGVVLSGSTALDVLATQLAAAEGPVGLEAFNAGFEQRTGYEWLSRDAGEVDAYVGDALCGFDLPVETVPAMLAPAARLADPDALAGIRPDLPLLIASGSADPLAGGGALVELLGQRYRDAGLTDVTVTVYDEARHEILNETNRDAVTADIVAWLDAHV